jgi:hypothetical protein
MGWNGLSRHHLRDADLMFYGRLLRKRVTSPVDISMVSIRSG